MLVEIICRSESLVQLALRNAGPTQRREEFFSADAHPKERSTHAGFGQNQIIAFPQFLTHLIERPILTFSEQGMHDRLLCFADASCFAFAMTLFKRLASLVSLNPVVDRRQPHAEQLG